MCDRCDKEGRSRKSPCRLHGKFGVIDVTKKGGVESPHAVCMESLGRNKAVKKGHRRYKLKSGKRVKI